MESSKVPSATASDVAVLSRLFLNGKRDLTVKRARYLLEVDFSDKDRARMHQLAVRNQEGQLSDDEREELLAYAKAGCLLGMIHSRARRKLRTSNGRARPR
jgi:hypothetical protein